MRRRTCRQLLQLPPPHLRLRAWRRRSTPQLRPMLLLPTARRICAFRLRAATALDSRSGRFRQPQPASPTQFVPGSSQGSRRYLPRTGTGICTATWHRASPWAPVQPSLRQAQTAQHIWSTSRAPTWSSSEPPSTHPTELQRISPGSRHARLPGRPGQSSASARNHGLPRSKGTLMLTARSHGKPLLAAVTGTWRARMGGPGAPPARRTCRSSGATLTTRPA